MVSLEKILAATLKDRLILDRLGEALKSDLVVANPFQRQIVAFADDFTLQHRTLPLPGDYEVWLSSLPDARRDAVKEALGRLLLQDTSDLTPGYFSARVGEELRLVAARNAKARLNTIQDLTPEAFLALAERVENVGIGGIVGLANLRDVDTWIFTSDNSLRPTGYPSLDEALAGGWGEELVIVFADSGVGKSMLLQNFAVHQAQKGKRVLEVTLELSHRPAIHRHYRQITQMDRATFRVEKTKARGHLEHWFRWVKGELLLLEYPAYTLDPDTLKRQLDRVSRAHGDVDCLVLDYLDLLILPPGQRGRGRYEDLGVLTHLLRSICPGWDIPVITASQAVRPPENAKRLTLRDMGDSYDKVRGADVILSLIQTREEKEVHLGRIGVLKARDSWGAGTEVEVYINRDLATIAPLRDPATQQLLPLTVDLMRRCGHLSPDDTPESGDSPREGLDVT